MKANRILLAAALVVAAAVSCSKEPAAPEQVGSYIKVYTTSVDTKTAISFDGDTGNVTWSEGDRLMFQFDGTDPTGKNIMTSTTGASGTFEVTVPEDAANVYVARMGDPSMKFTKWWASSAGHVQISFPQEMSASDWTFDNVNAIVGKAAVDAPSISLSPILCLMKFSVANTSINKLVFTPVNSNEFASAYQYNYADGTISVQSSVSYQSERTYYTGGTAGTYYVPVIPGTCQGFTVEAFDSSNASLGSANIPAFTAVAGAIRNYGALDDHLKTVVGTPAATFTTTSAEMVCAFGYTKTIEFTAAADWTATVKQSANGSVDVTSGTAGSKSLNLTFNPNTTSSRKTITLVISAPGYDDAELVFTQERKADYEVIFRNYPDAYSKDNAYRSWTSAGTLFQEKSEAKFGTFTLTNGGIQLAFCRYSTDTGGTANCGYNELGFLFGGNNGSPNYVNRGGYIQMPAISGKKLVKIELFTGANTANSLVLAKVATTDGTVVVNEMKSGVNSYSAAKSAIPSIQAELTSDYSTSYMVFNIAGSAVNTPYNLMFGTRSQIRWFTLYYE